MWFPTRAAVDFLNQALNLPATGQEQDWDLELSDAGRAGEFVAYLEGDGHELDTDQRRALMALVLASLDAMLVESEELADAEGIPSELWARVERMLRADRAKYADLLAYWGAQDDDPDGFRISPLLRSL